MEKYIQKDLQINSSVEPQDEYICSECGKNVGLIIDGRCYNCSNKLKIYESKSTNYEK